MARCAPPGLGRREELSINWLKTCYFSQIMTDRTCKLYVRISSFVVLLLAIVCANLSIQAADATLTLLAYFSATNGADPWAALVQGSDGNFYGTTYSGGPTTNVSDVGKHPGLGTVFKVTPDGVLTSLVAFYGTNGCHPRAELLQGRDGNFYGTTCWGGSETNVMPGGEIGYGTVFKMSPDGALVTLLSFNGTNGASPTGGLVEGADGNLYGTTRFGGASFSDPRAANGYGAPGDGTIFRISTNGEFATIFSFTPDTPGDQPMVSLTPGSDGFLYGIACYGPFNCGEIFRTSLDGTFTPIAALDSTIGTAWLSALIESRDGRFYGVSQFSAATNHSGVIYEVSANNSVHTTLSLTNSGGFSTGSLLEGTDGNLYGTTSGSSDYPYGYIYQVTPQGDYSVIASFPRAIGAGPWGGMIQARDGSLYGTALAGGPFATSPVNTADGYGTIFRLTVPSAAAPKLRAPIKAGTGVVLSWNALPGRSYQVQYKNALEDAAWNNLNNTAVSATNTIAFTSDTMPSSTRFYRVLLLPQ